MRKSWYCNVGNCKTKAESEGYMLIHLMITHKLNKSLMAVRHFGDEQIITHYDGIERKKGVIPDEFFDVPKDLYIKETTIAIRRWERIP